MWKKTVKIERELSRHWSSLTATVRSIEIFGGFLTWNTVNIACQKESKLDRGFSPSSNPLNLPPKTCIPSNAKITMKRNSKTSKLAIALIELISDATRFRNDVQYLIRGRER